MSLIEALFVGGEVSAAATIATTKEAKLVERIHWRHFGSKVHVPLATDAEIPRGSHPGRVAAELADGVDIRRIEHDPGIPDEPTEPKWKPVVATVATPTVPTVLRQGVFCFEEAAA